MSEIRLRAGVEWRTLEGRVVAMDVANGHCIALNRTGAALWADLVEGTNEERLVSLVTEKFEVDAERARADVDAFLAALRARGYLEK
jgi:hypothetical protein